MTVRRRAALTSAGVAVLAVVLHLLGDGELSGPPLTDPAALADWYEARSPATAMIALIRFVAETAAWYVVGLTVLHGVARAFGVRGIGRLTEALALPGTRRIVHAGLGLGLVAATAATSGEIEAGRAAPGTATMRPLAPAQEASGTGTARMTPRPAERAVDHVVAETTEPTPHEAEVVPRPTSWSVGAGESFWSIASDVLSDRLGREPSDTEIDPYWRSLVERNRDRLVDPTAPDLIHPGQVFELPPVPVAPTGVPTTT